jgi:hypothetical protein
LGWQVEWKRGGAVTAAVTVDAAVGGRMPSEPKNSAAVAMAPQFLAPCSPYRPPSGRAQVVNEKRNLPPMFSKINRIMFPKAEINPKPCLGKIFPRVENFFSQRRRLPLAKYFLWLWP